MLKPEQVAKAAAIKEKENLKFRSFLKNRVDESDLDARFLRLHNNLFADYDCSKCRNCCKLLSATIAEWDIGEMAECLNTEVESFKQKFLEYGECGEWNSNKTPCSFLDENDECILGECKPESCKDFPHTNKPGRLESLYSVLTTVSVCPVAFEIYEQLKIEYGFFHNGKHSIV